ncbi:MAG TPA: hypothetical protein VMB85_10255 [Bryobacteraceae bacterium]|nr:hypothetical protein [Bryobacteraceae bacterium]
MTMVSAVFFRYGRGMQSQPQLRNAVLGFVLVSFLAAAIAGFFWRDDRQKRAGRRRPNGSFRPGRMVMSGPETGLSTGSGSAAILAAGIGTFVLSILAIAADKVVSIKRLMMFHKPTGPLSGVTTSAILVWLVAWAILNARWRGRSVAMARVNTAAFILLGLSLLLTFPLVADLSRYARAVASSSRPMISVHYNQGSLTGEQRCPRKCRRMAGIRNCISVWFAYTFCTMPRRNDLRPRDHPGVGPPRIPPRSRNDIPTSSQHGAARMVVHERATGRRPTA